MVRILPFTRKEVLSSKLTTEKVLFVVKQKQVIYCYRNYVKFFVASLRKIFLSEKFFSSSLYTFSVAQKVHHLHLILLSIKAYSTEIAMLRLPLHMMLPREMYQYMKCIHF